jgi:PAS domain S-box-containing protein
VNAVWGTKGRQEIPSRSRNQPSSLRWYRTVAWVQVIGWTFAALWSLLLVGIRESVLIGAVGLLCTVATTIFDQRRERSRWITPAQSLASQISHLSQNLDANIDSTNTPELAGIARAISAILSSDVISHTRQLKVDTPFAPSGEVSAITGRSPHGKQVGRIGQADAMTPDSGDLEAAEMISRLDCRTFRWLDSSPAEQEFLGWSLESLKKKSFLEIIDPEDRPLAKTQLSAAIVKGEGHSLLYRIRTARDEVKAIELHVAVRYGRDESSGQVIPIYVKLRTLDMTKKVGAERELRRRTKELTDVNKQLRRINRELEDLKNRYSDLYHNAPALYFSLNSMGKVVQCNDTMLQTLGKTREQILGRPYTSVLSEARKPKFDAWFEILKKTGYVETENRWVTHNGRVIDIWIASTAVRSSDGSFRYSRSVGRDVTARRALEAELQDKNERLARANKDLSRKNKELDDFASIVAHDLKEPVRTLIAFSNFLETDCGDRLSDAGRDLLRHIVEAARRMRTLISDLQILGRAGRVAGDFARIDLNAVIERVRDDYAEMLRDRSASVVILGDLPDVWGDKTRLGQLIANLVSNGLKYNRSSHPQVQIEAIRSEGGNSSASTTLAFRDNGIGIDPKFHVKIFELFRRLHTRDEYEGTGAGLAICQKIVEAHGSRIWVESQAGSGSSFFVTLPLAPIAEPSDTPDDVV